MHERISVCNEVTSNYGTELNVSTEEQPNSTNGWRNSSQIVLAHSSSAEAPIPISGLTISPDIAVSSTQYSFIIPETPVVV
ncbi:unnamed protein product [Thelazia callipaeda]|uniref:Uncharacterized protein n=1 Tax=Thelazia callipaeda TaxID=103827 RepID=A0A0N5CP62_THECL|nr:unnamed protein product [Thelazia callipaeda]